MQFCVKNKYWNEYIIRFANTFQLNSVSVDKIQNVVKTKAGTALDLSCGGDTILAADGPLDQVKAVEQMLQIESSELVPQIDPSVQQPVVQSRRRPLLGPWAFWLKVPSSAVTFKTLC